MSGNIKLDSKELYVNEQKLYEVLKDITTPLWDAIAQLVNMTQQIVQHMNVRMDRGVNLQEELIDALDLKAILKVGDTKFLEMKKVF